ncbi:MAG: integrase [Microvirga sp.]|nr:integrase [Microvirga sp.]
MTIVRVKGFQIFRDRHGRPRCYHRRTHTAVDLQKAPIGSAEFFAECGRIAELAQKVEPKPGTLGLLINAYRGHSAFTDLAPLTQRDYQKIFDYLKPLADTPLKRFDRPLVVRIRDKALSTRGRRFANYIKACLSLLFAWGSERGYIATNSAAGIKDIRRRKGAPEANRPWSDEERDVVLAAAPAHMLPAIALMMFTGLGPKDALALPRSLYHDGEIATNRAKTGALVYWPVPRPLAAVLDEAPRHSALMLCVNSDGQPWTESGFRASWRTLRLRLEQEGRIGSGLTLYGLRHTVAVILREIGHDERTIADSLGQKTIEMARHYAKGADLRPKMRGVVSSFEAEVNRRRTKAVKPGV